MSSGKLMISTLVTIAIGFLIVFISPQQTIAISFTKVGKAEEKLDEAKNLFKIELNEKANERLNQAVDLLVEELSENPDNNEAQYFLGQCYWLRGEENRSLTLFKNAGREKAYKSKIITFLKSEATSAKDRGSLARVFGLYDFIVQVDSSAKPEIVQALKQDADNLMNKKQYDLAQLHYQTLSRYEPSTRIQASESFLEEANKTSDTKVRLSLYRVALAFDSSKRQKIVGEAADILKNFERKTYENDVDKLCTSGKRE